MDGHRGEKQPLSHLHPPLPATARPLYVFIRVTLSCWEKNTLGKMQICSHTSVLPGTFLHKWILSFFLCVCGEHIGRIKIILKVSVIQKTLQGHLSLKMHFRLPVQDTCTSSVRQALCSSTLSPKENSGFYINEPSPSCDLRRFTSCTQW